MAAKLLVHLRRQWIGVIALFVALGGTALATHPGGANTISSTDIINGEVRNDDLGANSVGSGKIADRQVKNQDLSIGASSSNTIADGGIQGVDVRNDTLTGTQVDESALDATPLRTRVAQGDCEGNSPDDVMVKVGSVCVDRYENSIWDAPTGGNQITGAIPCNANGQDCTDIYARSVAGVTPSSDVTWFQAQQALANSGKRLPTNAEWQMAVAGTPDSTDCNITTGLVANTGANANCVSNHGTNDMVGNLAEWVADWDEQAVDCETNWTDGSGGTFFGGGDRTCLGRGSGEASTRFPGALIRGGDVNDTGGAGSFAVSAEPRPSQSSGGIGFRGAR